MIRVTEDDFNVADEYRALINDNGKDGAVVFFVGLVRDMNQGSKILNLQLEHYPAMTEKALQRIVEQAKSRWQLGRVKLIHRIGSLSINDQIVFVGVTSQHREASFQAAQFIMDYLKTEAPFWKKERTPEGERWVDANDKDTEAKSRW
ncbi:molybdopterin synthase catalytic subunit MoaE [Pleionea sediminis]|uniref:molybdopterin synthase catalytic subunit MoaE n=1 Tax=Pleionea sediminis TaxID=2569479 RepID=UPI001186AF14|nr:molybdopterin synthase catalytic subunit MoaE [Pleionea sediminis]